MALRKGKMNVQVVLKEDIVKLIDQIAEKELTSRSSITAKIIEENIHKYFEKEGK